MAFGIIGRSGEIGAKHYAELQTGYGQPLPPRYLQEIERELSRLEMVLRHVADVEQGMAEPAQISNH